MSITVTIDGREYAATVNFNLKLALDPVHDPEPEPELIHGLNYASVWWHFDKKFTTDEVVHRDFKLFSEAGIGVVTLQLTPAWMWPTANDIRDGFIAEVKRVSAIAEQYGLDVILDIHTLSHRNSYTMPSWVSDEWINNVVNNPILRAAWIRLTEATVEILSDIPNLHSWHVLNEPYRGAWAINANLATVKRFMSDCVEAASRQTVAPVSIRLAVDSFDKGFNNDHTILDLMDYATFNHYRAYASDAALKILVDAAKLRRQTIMIGEYGEKSDNDATQAASIEDQISVFRAMGLNYAHVWSWRADFNIGHDGTPINNPMPIGGGWNLAADLEGTPRPAFYKLSSERGREVAA